VAEEYPVRDGQPVISCWPDRFTPEFIRESFNSYKSIGKQALWFQEHMLIITPTEGLLYNLDNIQKYDMNEMRRRMDQLTYYVSVDLAVSERTTADYTAIAVIGVNENNHWFLVDGFYGRIKPDDTIEKIFYYVARYRPYAVVLEKVAFQMAMKTFIQNEMMKRGIFFNLELVARTTQKLSVFKAFQPIVELGRFWVPENAIENFVGELLGEMSLVTNDAILSKHDDVLDAVAQLTLIEVISANPIKDDAGIIDEEPTVSSYIF
jgi:predicted phage terminase large subunit-like protein